MKYRQLESAAVAMLVLFGVLFSTVPAVAGTVPGVHTPIAIDPVVSIPDNHWLIDVYPVVLDRPYDVPGYKHNLRLLEGGMPREVMMNGLVASPEFTSKPYLADRSGFVTRLYRVLLKREPAAGEVAGWVANLRNADGSGSGLTWAQAMEAFYASAEYKLTQCHSSYYTLGAAVNPGALLMGDLFAGRARLQSTAESETVNLLMPSARDIFDQKLPVLKDPNPQADRYIAFTRGLALGTTEEKYNVLLLGSGDGVNFTEIGPVFDRPANQTYYDPHIAVDNGVCPRRYVMTLECLGSQIASLCTSQSTTPAAAETWNTPRLIVDGVGGAAARSASTGTVLIDGAVRYLGWTQVDEGAVRTDSRAVTMPDLFAYFGSVDGGLSPISIMMSAEPTPWCTSAWDCNNRDVQDWKREGSHYVALYNGANYYRCNGSWGVSMARSTVPVGREYTERVPLARGIGAERFDTCGISYPVLNVVNGEPFVYYAVYPAGGGNLTKRARLVPLPALLSWSATSLPHLIGRADADGWSASAGGAVIDPPGFLQYGPYTPQVPTGSRSAVWELMIDNHTFDNSTVVRLDLFDATTATVLAQRDVGRQEWTAPFEYQPFSMPFELDAARAGHQLEFRVYWTQRAYVRHKGVTVY